MADYSNYPTSVAPGGSITRLSSSASNITPTRAIWCTVAGTADITDMHGNTLTSVAFAVGWHPIVVKKVNNISSATLYAVR